MASNIYFDRSDRDLREFILAALAVEVFMILFFVESKVYDLATAAFVAYGLGLLCRGKLASYMALFAAANINRETSFLLTAVFVVYYFGRLPFKIYVALFLVQVLLFVGIRLALTTIYADHPGVDMLVRPLQNIALFMESPVRSLMHGTGFAVAGWACLKNWRASARILQVAFVVMAPALLVMYLVLGYSFEIRVFAEIFPVVWVMAFWKL